VVVVIGLLFLQMMVTTADIPSGTGRDRATQTGSSADDGDDNLHGLSEPSEHSWVGRNHQASSHGSIICDGVSLKEQDLSPSSALHRREAATVVQVAGREIYPYI
jgi:hypothetical protein